MTIDYTQLSCLYIETADRRMFSDYYSYYGRQYSGAVGHIYRLNYATSLNRIFGPNEEDTAYIKSITPEIVHPHNNKIGEILPIRVVSQERRGEELVLEVVVDFSQPYARRAWGAKHREGNTYTVVLFGESAQRRT